MIPARRHLPWVLVVLACALAPHLGSLDAPWISDDAAALAFVHEHGPFADWTSGQYGMRIVRFWRPLVTTTLGLQELWTGVDPSPLRCFNLLGHAVSAVLAGMLALRLGGRRLGALGAGVLVALFPHAGGTVTWIVGRVDAQTVPLILAAVWFSLAPTGASPAGGGNGARGRPWRAWAAGAATFLACASKELGFITPALVGWVLLGATGSVVLSARRAFPALAGALVAFAWRRLALGTWVGGYPSPEMGPAELRAAARLVAESLSWPLLSATFLSLEVLFRGRRAQRPTGSENGRREGGGWTPLLVLAAGLTALVPLAPLLVDGVLEPQNHRVLFLADTFLCLSVGVALGRLRSRVAVGAGLLVLVALGVVRGLEARSDVAEWRRAAELGAEHVERVRVALADAEPTEAPVLDATMPAAAEGAYCLAWGVADRFRAPFPPAARPVWPLRLMFVAGERERPRVTRPSRNLVWKFGETPRTVPEFTVSIAGEQEFGPLELDLDVAGGGGPVLELWGRFPEGRFEAVVYTELGYEAAALGPSSAGSAETDPDGVPSKVLRVSLGQILRAAEVASLGEALMQAADAGATRAYLELRAVDDAKGIANRPVGASRMIPLRWAPDLLERLKAGG